MKLSDAVRDASEEFVKLQASIDQTLDKIRAKALDKSVEASQLLDKYTMMLKLG